MKKLFTVLVIKILLLTALAFAGEAPRKIIKIDLAGQSKKTIHELYQLGLDITQFDRTGESINALVREAEVETITGMGLTTNIILPDADAFARQLRSSDYFDHFHSYHQMLQELQEVVANHPDIALLKDIGDSFEKTAGRGGYDIWMMKLSDNVTVEEQDEPEVLFMANIHAREIITPEVVMYFIHYMVDNYGTDPYVTYLINNRQIWLCPMINPDGHEYVFSGSGINDDPMWWRKNKSDNNNNGIFDPNYDGVDLNRNFGYKWGYDNMGSSPNPSSETYRGSAPFSEAESQAIRDFVESHNFVVSLSFHSYGRWWLFPWGYDVAHPNTPHHDQFVALAESCVTYNGYIYGNGLTIGYPTNGDTDDWLYGEQTTKNKIFAFTPEVGSSGESLGGSGFFPDTLFIDKLVQENQGPLFYMAYAAGENPIVESSLRPDTEDLVGPYAVTMTVKPPIILTEPVPLNTASFKLFFNTTGVPPFDSVPMVATANEGQYIGYIPGTGKNETIYYFFSASDSLGRTGLAPRLAPVKLFSFHVSADTIPPVIVHYPLPGQSFTSTSFLITATVTDNIGIAHVKLYYRQNGAAMDSLVMTSGANPGEYNAMIVPDSITIGDLFEYRIVATDMSQNANTAAAPVAGFYRFSILGGYIFDFEANNGGFTTNSPGDWQWGTPSSGPRSAHSGNNVWATKLRENYSNSSDSRLETPPLDLTGIAQATLTFWHWYQNESSQGSLWDGGNVKISADGGPFEIITPVDGYDGIIDDYNVILPDEPAFGGPRENGNFWHQEYFDLNAYANKNIVIRLHFGSDDNTTEPGWYIDDFQVLLSATHAPLVTHTTRLPNTSDNVGPYRVQAKITDDATIASASLSYRLNSGPTFVAIPMTDQGNHIYQGQIPGQPYGTTVDYYVQATDNTANVTTDPPDAPTTTFSFFVTKRVPELQVVPTEFSYFLTEGEIVIDSILVKNNGLLDLNFTVWDSLLSGAMMPGKPSVQTPYSFSLSIEKMKKAVMNSKFLKKTPQSAPDRQNEVIDLQLIVRDQTGDIIQLDPNTTPATTPDLAAIYAEKQGNNLTIEIEFTKQIERNRYFVLMSADLDQDLTTGEYPPKSGVHDIGVEREIVWDTANQMGLSSPSVLVMDCDINIAYGYTPITFNGNKMSATIPLATLNNDDGNMNVGFIAMPIFSPETPYADFAPEIGHAVIGFETGLSWIGEFPSEGSLTGEDSMYIHFYINSAILAPGNYTAAIIFSSNDPVTPDKYLPIYVNIMPVAVEEGKNAGMLPEMFNLYQNYPNPFNPQTNIQYQLPQSSQVILQVFNMTGQEVRTLVDTRQPAGYYELTWDGKDNNGIAQTSGMYFVKISATGFTQTRKMLLLR